MTKIAVDTRVMGSIAAEVSTAAAAVADLGGHLAGLGVRATDFSGASEPLGEALRQLLRAWGPVASACRDDLVRLHDAVVAVAEVWDEIEGPSGEGSS